MSAIRLAFLNLTRRRVPTLVALVAIAISVATSGILLRLYELSESRFSTLARGGDAIVGAKAGELEILLDCLNLEGPYPDFIPLVLYQSLKDRSSVQFADGKRVGSDYLEAVIPFVFFGRFHRYRVIGTDESFLHRPDPEDAPVLVEGKWAGGAGEIVLGSEVARQERLKVGDSLVANAWTGDKSTPEEPALQVTFRVSGIFAGTGTAWDQALFSNLDEARKVFEASDLGDHSIWKGNVLHYFLVYLPPTSFASLDALINQRTVAQVIPVRQALQRLKALTGTGRELGLMVCLLILLLGGLSVSAMMVTRFDAMSIQLAVLRAIGYEKNRIRSWLLWEGALLGLAACAPGALVDWLLFPLIRAMLGTALPPSSLVQSPIYQSAPVWITAMAATTLAVFIPLLRVYRQDVHLALKGM